MAKALTIFTLFIILACGEGGNNNYQRDQISVCLYNLSNGTINITNQTYIERFLSFYNEEGNLYFIDPSQNAKIILKDNNILTEPMGPKILMHGTYNSQTNIIKGYGPKYLIYVKDKKVYIIDVHKNENSYPIRVSSENTITAICDDLTIPDYSDPAKSIYMYYASKDVECWNGDEELKLIILNMDNSSNPISLGNDGEIVPLGVFRDANTLSITEIILMEKLQNGLYDLKACNIDMSTCSSILPAEFSPEVGIAKASVIANYLYNGSFHSAIVVEGKLYIYNGSQMVKPSEACEFNSGNLKVDQDGNAIYIASGKKIWKFTFSEQNCYLLKEEDATVSQLRVGENRIIYRVSNTVKSILKSTGNSEKTLKVSKETLWIEGIGNDIVFYNIYGKSEYVAGYVKEDGSEVREFRKAFWGGAVYNNDIPTYQKTKHSMILVSFSGCTQETVHLGTLDKLYRSLYIRDSAPGYILGKAYINAVTGDIVMFNTISPGSFKKITDTLELNEYMPR